MMTTQYDRISARARAAVLHIGVGATALGLAALATTVSCTSDTSPPAASLQPSATEQLGQVKLNLLGSSQNGVAYRLNHAILMVQGRDRTLFFDTESGPNEEYFTEAVPAGSYSVFLQEGWELESLSSGEGVLATLVSPNPDDFTVVAGESVTVSLLFRVGDDVVSTEPGSFEIGIAVSEVNGSSGGGQTLPPECLPSGQLPRLKLTPIASGLDQPTFAASAPGDASRLYVLEQTGRMLVLENGQARDQPFLDLRSELVSGGEQGLLGLAFHPDYASNGRFFVHYSSASVPARSIDEGDGVIAEFSRSITSDTLADPLSQRQLLVVHQPYPNHNGGMLAFSPKDGFLYIGLGDGGSGGDPHGNGQNLSTWLGKMLRIDVDSAPQSASPSAAQGLSYGIPAGNMGGAALPEIWSYGLRNPWRFSFDACSGDLYIGDVGQNQYEEIDYEPANTPGRNYGWSQMEGRSCFGGACQMRGLTLPVIQYGHDLGCSVTGGYVYRGAAIPALRGYYFYTDYCSGKFWRARIENGQAREVQDITADLNPRGLGSVSSFGVDARGELLVVDQSGTIYRIEAE